jgi:hypothetical protein
MLLGAWGAIYTGELGRGGRGALLLQRRIPLSGRYKLLSNDWERTKGTGALCDYIDAH